MMTQAEQAELLKIIRWYQEEPKDDLAWSLRELAGLLSVVVRSLPTEERDSMG